MKNRIFSALTFLFVSSAITAQTGVISRFFSEYDARQDVTFISLSGKAFELSQQINFENADGFKKIAAHVNGLKMVIDDHDMDAKNTALRVRKMLNSNFEEVITIVDKDATLHILINEADGVVSEVLAIAGHETNFVMASLTGSLKFEDVATLTKQFSTINNKAFSHSSVHPGNVEIYPNPVYHGSQLNVVLPEDFDGSTVQIFNMGGLEVLSFYLRIGQKKIDLKNLGQGAYILKAQKGDFYVSKKFMIN